ncbi:MAG: 50S ribosomal protein L10 [Alphaproteobacteria bacterium MarineAlpha5_Bin9]|nr:MAG: 50S ribosomal protein L10 [Alphaproteobacteria bacterium MarineAlpha5_Bin9]
MRRSEKSEYVSKLKEELNNSSTVVVAHYKGLNVSESEELRKKMRENGAKFQVTKNTLTKLALTNSKNEAIKELFTGPTAIAYSQDPIAPAKVAVEFGKKHTNLKIIGGMYEGEKIDNEKINFLASLPSLDEIKGKLIGLINAPAQKIVSILQEPGSKVARIISARNNELEKSN